MRRILFLLLASLALPAAAHDEHSLGVVDFKVSCTPDAQAKFTRAVSLLHHMTYPQARTAFEAVLAADPDCAMGHWGIAMTLFQPLWPTRPNAAALQRGYEEAAKARALDPPTPREQGLVAAVSAFFDDPTGTDYWARIARFADAMTKLHAELPDDPEVSAFYGLAHLATSPASGVSRKHADEAAAVLTRVYADNPEHPGAMHYLVHANDVPGRERELLEVTRKYESVAPDNPHALHMPTHIYTRLGEWDSVIRGNRRAADAALRYPAGEHGEFVWDEFPHAIEYLVYAHLQKGEDDLAKRELDRLHGTAKLEPSFKTAFHFASTKARYALERRDWAAAAAIEPRMPAFLDWDRFPWAEAVQQFARGLGAAKTGKLDVADAAAARLRDLEAHTAKLGEELFARQIQVLRLGLSAWIDEARGDATRAVENMREAAALESATPKHAVTPGPTLPAEEMLGDLLLAHGDAKGALAAYERSLAAYPNRGNSLLGAKRAADAAGDAKAGARHAKSVASFPALAKRDG